MNVEDSYEGAVRRLRRLGHPVVEISPPPVLSRQLEQNDGRMRELEELATLACDENERLTGELEGARGEIERLREHIVSLQQQVLAVEQAARPEAARTPRGRGGAFYFLLVVVLLGYGAAGAAYLSRPSHLYRSVEELQSLMGQATATATPAHESAPATAAPQPAQPAVQPVAATPAAVKVEPAATSAPTPAASAPTAAPAVAAPKATPAAAAPSAAPSTSDSEADAPAPVKSHRQHASKHHAVKSSRHDEHKHAAAKTGTVESNTNDPLGGLGF